MLGKFFRVRRVGCEVGKVDETPIHPPQKSDKTSTAGCSLTSPQKNWGGNVLVVCL